MARPRVPVPPPVAVDLEVPPPRWLRARTLRCEFPHGYSNENYVKPPNGGGWPGDTPIVRVPWDAAVRLATRKWEELSPDRQRVEWERDLEPDSLFHHERDPYLEGHYARARRLHAPMPWCDGCDRPTDSCTCSRVEEDR